MLLGPSRLPERGGQRGHTVDVRGGHPSLRLFGRDAPEVKLAGRSQGCGPHGAAVRSLTSWDASNGRKFAAKPSTKSLLA